MLDLRRLRLLSELSRHGTIAAVARVVGYTPSAISQSLAQLEREVGTSLLERDGRRVRLTPAAHGLVARTDRVLAELDAAEAELAAEHETVRGEIVIGAFPSAAAGLVVPAIVDLSARHPELSCTVREHEPEDGIPLLRSGGLDLLVSESYEAGRPGAGRGARIDAAARRATAARPPARAPRTRARRAPDACRTRNGSPGSRARSSPPHSNRRAVRPASAPGSSTAPTTRASSRLWSRKDSGSGCFPRSPAPARRASASPSWRSPSRPRRHVSALVRRGAPRRPALAAVLEALLLRAAAAPARAS